MRSFRAIPLLVLAASVASAHERRLQTADGASMVDMGEANVILSSAWTNGGANVNNAAAVTADGTIPISTASTPNATGGTAAAPGATAGTNANGLSEDDIDFLVKVRQAGLWEIPAGQQAQEPQRNTSPLVQAAGKKIATDHVMLDDAVRQLAGQLGVPLPDKPSDEQQGFLNELAPASGQDFDSIFANRIRMAHGKVFQKVIKVRATTTHPLIREFAATAVEVVMSHMAAAEQTGRVNPPSLNL